MCDVMRRTGTRSRRSCSARRGIGHGSSFVFIASRRSAPSALRAPVRYLQGLYYPPIGQALARSCARAHSHIAREPAREARVFPRPADGCWDSGSKDGSSRACLAPGRGAGWLASRSPAPPPPGRTRPESCIPETRGAGMREGCERGAQVQGENGRQGGAESGGRRALLKLKTRSSSHTLPKNWSSSSTKRWIDSK